MTLHYSGENNCIFAGQNFVTWCNFDRSSRFLAISRSQSLQIMKRLSLLVFATSLLTSSVHAQGTNIFPVFGQSGIGVSHPLNDLHINFDTTPHRPAWYSIIRMSNADSSGISNLFGT